MTSAPTELLLTVARADGRPDDVLVTVQGDARVGDLAAALAPDAEHVRLYSRRLDAWLPSDRRASESDLRSGDEVAIALGHVDRLADGTLVGQGMQAAELVVTSGPAAGLRRPLRHRRYTVGRDASCDMTIDDPSMSRTHLELELTGVDVIVRDAGSSNGSAVGGVRLRAGEARVLGDGEEVQAGRTLLAVRQTGTAGSHRRAQEGRVLFNRPPRVARPFTPPTPAVGVVPQEPKAQRMPLGAALIPLVLGVAMAALLGQVALLLFAVLSPAMIGWTYISDRRSGRSDHKQAVAAFDRRLTALEQELSEAREREIAERRRGAPDTADLAMRAQRQGESLWERRAVDSDFLSLRVGVADQPSLIQIPRPDADDDSALARRLSAIADRFTGVPAVPVVADLRAAGAIGLCGDDERVASMGRSMALQLGVLHSPRDLVLTAAIGHSAMSGWEWLKWLPHVRAEGSPLQGAHLAAGTSEARELIRELRALIHARQEARVARRDGAAAPAVVLVLDESVAGDRALVADLLEHGPEVGVLTIWLGREQRDLPGECGRVVVLRQDVARARVIEVETGRVLDDVTADGLPLAVALETARSLCALRDVGAGAAQDELPRAVSLLELLSIDVPSGDLLAARWAAREPGAVRAPIGASPAGPYILDLLADGPHALIAGTTGAGKSELLQTLVGALAATLPPDRLSFLFVDYKGGTGLQDFETLPHSVGIVTDLDGSLTQRALVSLRAEIKRRETQLTKEGARDLRELERRRPDVAPARLVLIVDEFATLAKEVPEFIEGVVDIAQRGRSLGVHLVLATQRPAGVITADVRANANLRIALRVADVNDSEDVIQAPDAARISRRLPGRAYVRVGHGELSPLQVAYAGGLSGPGAGPSEVTVAPFGFGGEPDEGAQPREETPATDSDLRRLVAAAGEAADIAGSRRPPSPWLPQLPERLVLEALGPGPAIGLLDEPAAQRQVPLELDLEADGSMLIYGAMKSGKTALLRTIACVLARDARPDELTLLGLDCASRGLDVLEALPHCAGVVGVDDEERVSRLLRWLRRTIDRRRGGGDAGPRPRIVLLLDGYGGFTAEFERSDAHVLVDLLPRIIADGRAVGVHVIATGDRRGAFPTAVSSIVSRRLVLRLADEDDYSVLGVELRPGTTLPPGRGFTGDSLEFQAALPSGRADDETIRAVGAELERRYGGLRAPALALLPTQLAFAGLPSAPRPLTAVIGVEEDDHAPVALDLRSAHAVVAGPYRSGRTTALGSIARALKASTPGVELHALVPRRRPLGELADFTTTAVGFDECVAAAARLAALVDARDPDTEQPPVVVFADDGGELADGPVGDALALIVRRGRDVGVRVVMGIEVGTARGAWQTVIKDLRKDGNGLLLDPDIDVDGDVLGVRLPRRRMKFPAGRGYLVDNGTLQLVQVAV